jgi:hypothetical protein
MMVKTKSQFGFILMLVLISLGCSGAPIQSSSPLVGDLPDLGPAPELLNEIWINTDQPLRLADLRGKVVLLEMWTYS